MFKFFLVSAALVAFVVGHGSVHEPVSRQTRWRYDPSATPNTNDYALNCGNFNVSSHINSVKFYRSSLWIILSDADSHRGERRSLRFVW